MLSLIDHDAFGALRLVDFVPIGDARRGKIELIDNWEYMGTEWIGEAYGAFTVFLRPWNSASALGAITLDLEDFSSDLQGSVLRRLGLPIRYGITRRDVEDALGLPDHEKRFMPDRITLYFRIGLTYQYLVSTTIHQNRGLLFVEVIRADVLDRIEKDREAEVR